MPCSGGFGFIVTQPAANKTNSKNNVDRKMFGSFAMGI